MVQRNHVLLLFLVVVFALNAILNTSLVPCSKLRERGQQRREEQSLRLLKEEDELEEEEEAEEQSQQQQLQEEPQEELQGEELLKEEQRDKDEDMYEEEGFADSTPPGQEQQQLNDEEEDKEDDDPSPDAPQPTLEEEQQQRRQEEERSHDAPSTSARSRPLRVSILETQGYHDEVVAALAYALAARPSSEVRLALYLNAHRFGIDEVYAQFFDARPDVSLYHSNRVKELMRRADRDEDEDVLVMTTCGKDYWFKESVIKHLLRHTRTHVFCVVHHADAIKVATFNEIRIMTDFYAPWIEKRRITFLTLSPHVSDRLLSHTVPKWRRYTTLTPRVETFVPVFPVVLPARGGSIKGNEKAIAIQGDFSPKRRSYGAMMSQLETIVKSPAKGSVDLKLHLIGSGGEFDIPKALADRVVIDSSLDYLPYYKVISQSVAVLPAFASDGYYVERASSTVPASLIAGCPLIANRRLLATYGYLDESIVWLQEDGETELDAAVRVAQEVSEEERQAKKDKVRMWTQEQCAKNVRELFRWVGEAKTSAAANGGKSAEPASSLAQNRASAAAAAEAKRKPQLPVPPRPRGDFRLPANRKAY